MMMNMYHNYAKTLRNAQERLGRNTIVAFQRDDEYHIMSTGDNAVDIHHLTDIWGDASSVDQNKDSVLRIPVSHKRLIVDVFRAHRYNVIVVPRPYLGGIKGGDGVVEQDASHKTA